MHSRRQTLLLVLNGSFDGSPALLLRLIFFMGLGFPLWGVVSS
jgi:hypothetical protein